MNFLYSKICILFLFLTIQVFSQAPTDSWSFGFGATYPRMMSVWSGSWAGIGNYGGYLNLQRDFSEHVGLRLTGRYTYMKIEWSGNVTNVTTNNMLATDIDLIYYWVPCEPITPFLSFGFGGALFSLDNSPQPQRDVTYYEYQFNLGLGAQWRISDRWSLRAEGIYHTSSSNRLDGHMAPGADKGLFGGNSDTYITLNAGLQFYFSKGDISPLCDLYTGIKSEPVNYPTLEDIEKLIKKYPCPDPCPEIVVEKPVQVGTQWVLVGVNFEFNSAQLKAESYPILFHAVQYLNHHSDIRVEIQGHTDHIGSDAYNQTLSERRAKSVKDYLVSKGIDSNRLTIKGYGESTPIADNNTPEGRALNRRIEFKITE